MGVKGKPSQNCCQEKVDPKVHLHDPISYAIGEFGRWQCQLTFLLALFNFPCTWHIFVLTFQGNTGGDFWCARPPNLKDMPVSEWMNLSGTNELTHKGSSRYNPCVIKDLNYNNLSYALSNDVQATSKCSSWEFAASRTGDTIVSEWSLVCDKEQLRAVAEMMFLLGVALGGFFSGLVSDRFGRKKTLMTSLLLQIIIGILVAVSPWFELFLILRAILGFVCVSIVFSGLILCMELVGGKWLTISGVSYMFPVPLSYIIIAGIAYVTHGWRSLQLAITLPSILFLGLWWILPESPRWLLAMGKVDEVVEVLKEAARVNKKALPSNIDKILKQSISAVDLTDRPKGRVLDLFRTPTIRLISLVLYVVWFSVYLVYYGLVLNLSNIGGDVYVNSIISGLVEVPAIALSILILLKMGRRAPLCLTLVCSGVACFLTLIVPISNNVNGNAWEWLTITLAMIGKFSISSSNVVMPVFTAELFPTVIRNLGVGSSNVPAGIALMIVPYLWNMAAMNYHLPMTILGMTGIIGGLSVLLLPETANQGLTDTLDDIEEETSAKKPKEVEPVK
ncbi:organic cation transporter protein-like isoform X2 [Planococcus citri]|uniref:organic cation transporter protein-like isoform X2 n=1 Tax=Planococcus citri TaxID=170843 RepID=UPI0031F989C3